MTPAKPEDQQLRAFAAAAEAEICLPADAFVIGEPIEVVAIHYPGNPRAGLVRVRVARLLPLVIAGLALARTARADDAEVAPVVLVVPTTEAQDGLAPQELADALDLVLGDLGIRTRTGPPIAAPSFERAMSSATAIGRAERALAIVWTTARSGGAGLVAHVLDLRAGRAVIQALAVGRAGREEDLGRVVALKVRALLRLALAERTQESRAVQALVAPVAARAAPAAVLRAGLGWQAALGASAPRHGPVASVSLALPWSLEVEGRVGFLGAPDVLVPTGLVQTSEIEVALELRRRFDGPLGLSLAPGPMARLHALRSTGVTHDGRSGAAHAVIPELGLGVSLHGTLGRAAALQLHVSGGAMLGRQRMLLQGLEAFDLGTFGAAVRLALVIPGR
jgi:hypothetical protein